MGSLERRLEVSRDMHHGDQLSTHPTNPHIVNFEYPTD